MTIPVSQRKFVCSFKETAPAPVEPAISAKKKSKPPPVPFALDIAAKVGEIAPFDQGATGSCCAQAGGKMFDYLAERQKIVLPAPFSRLFLYACARLHDGQSSTALQDTGTNPYSIVQAAIKYGTVTEDVWPFDPAKVDVMPPPEIFAEAKKGWRPGKWWKLAIDEPTFTRRMLAGDMILVGLQIFTSVEMAAVNNGQVPLPGTVGLPGTTTDSPRGGHAGLLTGWSAGRTEWTDENSWGAYGNSSGRLIFPVNYLFSANGYCGAALVVENLVEGSIK